MRIGLAFPAATQKSAKAAYSSFQEFRQIVNLQSKKTILIILALYSVCSEIISTNEGSIEFKEISMPAPHLHKHRLKISWSWMLLCLAIATAHAQSASPALADRVISADSRAQPAALDAATNAPRLPWQGFHIGGLAGVGRSHAQSEVSGVRVTTLAPAIPATHELLLNGNTAGLELGYDQRFGPWVVGLAADWSSSDTAGATTSRGALTNRAAFTAAQTQSLDWLGSFRGRIGYVVQDRWLVHGTAGVAYGRVHASSNFQFPGVIVSGDSANLQVGWIAGLGSEYRINQRWTAKAEYLYFDLGHATIASLRTPFQGGQVVDTRFKTKGPLLRVGLNYSFAAPDSKTAELNDESPDANTQLGMRYWYSSGQTAIDVFGFTRGAMISRLTYRDLTAPATEIFFRHDRPGGAFIKGYIGIAKANTGSLKDEDFPPAIRPYSAAVLQQKDGHLAYLDVDVGYTFWQRAHSRWGGFIGFSDVREKINTMGCVQIASHPTICTPNQFADSTLAISEDGRWQSTRLGLVGELQFAEKWKLTGEAAWLPYTRFEGADAHWLRIGGDLPGPISESGVGHRGMQLEVMLDHAVARNFNIGAGVRFWQISATGTGRTSVLKPPQVLDFRTKHFGAFIQSSVAF